MGQSGAVASGAAAIAAILVAAIGVAVALGGAGMGSDVVGRRARVATVAMEGVMDVQQILGFYET